MNNRQADHALPEGFARNIVNCDVESGGRPRRRAGMTRVLSAVGSKNGFSCDLGAFFVEGGAVKQWDGTSATTLISGVSGDVAFCEANDVVYLSDTAKTWKIVDGVVHSWGITPPPAPLLATTSGTLPAGKYIAALVWVDANGLESGASAVRELTTSSEGGIVFRDLPFGANTLRIYLSAVNGSILYHVADTSTNEYTVSTWLGNGNVLENRNISGPVPAQTIRFYNGRLYLATGALVFYSEPFRFDHYRLDEGYLALPDDHALMEPVTMGIYLATDKATWFYMGNPDDGFNVFKKFDYGAIPGTAVRNIDGSIMWQSQRGMIIGSPEGECKNMQEDNVAPDSAVAGSAVLIERNGLRHYVASLKEPTASPLAAKSWIDAEVIRRGA